MPSASIPAAIAASAGTATELSSGALIAADTAATAGGFSTLTAASALPSLSSLATYASLGSAALGGVGAVMQGRAASAAAGYNAQVAANNATIATNNANAIGAQGEQNVAAAGAKTKAAIGATLADQGASGVEVNSGSSVNVRESESKLGMLNALNIRSQAAQAAYGQQTQSAADTGQESLYKSQQISDELGGYISAGSTILGGVGNAYKFSTPQYVDYIANSGATAGLTGN